MAAFMSTNSLGIEEVWAAITSLEDVDIEGLKAHCRSGCRWCSCPAASWATSTLPINAMGKVDRSRLKDIVTANAETAEDPGMMPLKRISGPPQHGEHESNAEETVLAHQRRLCSGG